MFHNIQIYSAVFSRLHSNILCAFSATVHFSQSGPSVCYAQLLFEHNVKCESGASGAVSSNLVMCIWHVSFNVTGVNWPPLERGVPVTSCVSPSQHAMIGSDNYIAGGSEVAADPLPEIKCPQLRSRSRGVMFIFICWLKWVSADSWYIAVKYPIFLLCQQFPTRGCKALLS